MLGSSVEALALFRISLGILLVIELILRFRFLHVFYSDEGYDVLFEFFGVGSSILLEPFFCVRNPNF